MLTDEQVAKLINKFNITSQTFITDDKYKKFKAAYKYAVDMTNREAHQGAEGLIHNLNSLQSRSGWDSVVA